MTKQQALEVAQWRSSPLTSKTMWTIYVGQGSLGFGLYQYLDYCAKAGVPASTVVLCVFVAGIVALAMTGIVGISWTDPAVAAVRAFKNAPAQAVPEEKQG